MTTLQVDANDMVFDALINTPVSDREWVEALVSCAFKYKTIHCALVNVFCVGGLYLSPKKWKRIKESAQRLNPKPPAFISNSHTALHFICDNFSNASKCIFAEKPEEAVNWILSGQDKKRAIMPRKKSTQPKRQGARLILNNFRERDDSTAWNKCK